MKSGMMFEDTTDKRVPEDRRKEDRRDHGRRVVEDFEVTLFGAMFIIGFVLFALFLILTL
ncbi:MAG: hypothetical protein OEZ59_11180 [Deltaproteobacteria bacterium]|nr:hypothetical protein [Deltaproteobacteria bacterium]